MKPHMRLQEIFRLNRKRRLATILTPHEADRYDIGMGKVPRTLQEPEADSDA